MQYSQLSRSALLFVGFFLGMITAPDTLAQWSPNPYINNPVCIAQGGQGGPRMCPDGSGGVVIVWGDQRPGTNGQDIYAQRISATGTVQWMNDGVAVCMAHNEQRYLSTCSDGSGGVICAWIDFRSGTDLDIYAQRINAMGAVQWTTNGVAICALPETQQDVKICSDGSGGAIITWADWRQGISEPDIYAQRINGAGAIQWAANGVMVSTDTLKQRRPEICSDGSGGAVIEYIENDTVWGITAQRINAAGIPQWASDGVPIRRGIQMFAYATEFPAITPDGTGGAIVAWPDFRTTIHHDIYAQRIDGSGTVQWTPNGVPICTAPRDQLVPAMCTDGSGGAIITWTDERTDRCDVYAQRISSGGTVLWNTNGVAISTASSYQDAPKICTDGMGGAIITWFDGRSLTSGADIYAQRVNAAGMTCWLPNGNGVCLANGGQNYPQICGDGSNGAVIAWMDGRGATTGQDIYASKLRSSGLLFPVQLRFFSAEIDAHLITLTWETASEINVHGFAVERQVGSHDWEDIAFVTGHATDDRSDGYLYRDKLPTSLLSVIQTTGGGIRYRLRQIDSDGSFTYSPVVEVWLENTPTTPQLHSSYPIPATVELTVPVFLPEDVTVTLTMSSLCGKVVRHMCVGEYVAAGYHSFLISTEDLPTGMYMITLSTPQSRYMQLIQVVH